jgi:3'(2'), 5'-bisphosphate nucleotidase
MLTSAADDELAAKLAHAAGDLLLSLRSSTLFEGRELGRVGDALSQVFLANALGFHRPKDGVLSEEQADDSARLDLERVWVIDPLDGTREYGESREDWAVHVCLAIHGTPGPSAVAVPARGQVWSTAMAGGPVEVEARPLRIAVSRSRAPEIARLVAADLSADLVPLGSAGFKAMAVLDGTVDAYLHAGGQYEWDSAAPVGVALARGLHASRIDGSALVYNQPNPLLPDLLICRPEWADRILSSVAAHLTGDPGELT